MTFEELLNVSEPKNYSYEDYMSNQPMRDGEEMRCFFDEINNDDRLKDRLRRSVISKEEKTS